MQTQRFKSNTSQDEINITMYKKSHRAICKIKNADSVIEHIKLIGLLVSSLKKEDIKWVEIFIDFKAKLPLNTISYINKFNGNFVCHIEDFEKFYLANMESLIKINCIYVDPFNKVEDGWIVVSDQRKKRKEKYEQFKQETISFVGDWNIIV